jgi:hypothetical protein
VSIGVYPAMGIAFVNTFVIATVMIAFVQSLRAVPHQLAPFTIRRLTRSTRCPYHERVGQTSPRASAQPGRIFKTTGEACES